MTDKQEVDEQDEEGSGDEAENAEQPDDEPDSNFLPRQIEDDQDATWFLTP